MDRDTPSASAVDGMSEDPPGRSTSVEVVIDESVAGAIAAHAASTVGGVVRLEPGLGALVTHLTARARDQIRRGDPGRPAPTEGVEVTVDGSTLRVHIDLATSSDHQAASVAHQVQATVAARLLADAGLSATAVSVSVLDIDQPGPPGRVPT